MLSYLVRSGRALAFPIYKGTYERGSDEFRSDYPKGTSGWRDHVIALSKDLYDTGHNLPINDAVKQTLDWFDQHFGPVR